jgi:hypothetical protein
MEREEILTIYKDGPEAVINLIEQLTAIIAEFEEFENVIKDTLLQLISPTEGAFLLQVLK